MDLDTFLTTVYVVIDDWYSAEMATQMQRHAGPALKMSDSEVLTLAIAGQWRAGVPWQSERGLVRYMQAHGLGWFPQMLARSAFNERVRQLCLALVALQQYLATQVSPGGWLYEVGDGLPVPVCSLGQAARDAHRWLMQVSRGHGGNHGGWFFGQRWWVSITPEGAITGWLVAAAHLNERWLLEAFLSQRGGDGEVRGPLADAHTARAERPLPPGGFIGGLFAVGKSAGAPYIVDRGLNGGRWLRHWRDAYEATVIAIPPANSADFQAWTRQDCHWLASVRQKIEGAFAILEGVLALKRVQAHSQWGQYTRLAAKAAAYNLGLYINQAVGRPLGAFATLIC
jgi:hypothetical protein